MSDLIKMKREQFSVQIRKNLQNQQLTQKRFEMLEDNTSFLQ